MQHTVGSTVVQPSPCSLEVLRVLAEVHRQLPVTGSLHFDLQQSNVRWKAKPFLSLRDLHTGCFHLKRECWALPASEGEAQEAWWEPSAPRWSRHTTWFPEGSPQITQTQEQREVLRFGSDEW